MMQDESSAVEGADALSYLSVQVVGFLILSAGTSMYNELLRGCLPGVPPPVPQDQSLEVPPQALYTLCLHVPAATASPVTATALCVARWCLAYWLSHC